MMWPPQHRWRERSRPHSSRFRRVSLTGAGASSWVKQRSSNEAMIYSFMCARTTATQRARRRSATLQLATKAILLPTATHTKAIWSTTNRIFDGRAALNFTCDVCKPEPSKVAPYRAHTRTLKPSAQAHVKHLSHVTSPSPPDLPKIYCSQR